MILRRAVPIHRNRSHPNEGAAHYVADGCWAGHPGVILRYQDWEVRDLEQLVESMDIGEVASLLGISRWELEKRCQSLGIHIRGSKEVEE